MHTCSSPTRRLLPRRCAFSYFELLVVLAICFVLLALAIPLYSALRQRAHKQVALDKMRILTGTVGTYAGQHGGTLPAEDAAGNDSWDNIAKPTAKEVWYNALPRIIGRKGAGDYASAPATFYSDENLLYLPGANYPDKKKLLRPLFAIAFNTKLQHTDAAHVKQPAKMEQMRNPAKTVVLLEQGVLNESRTLSVQSKNDYDGSPKGSAKSFVGRYSGKGMLGFADGHVELVAARDLLTETGQFPFPQTTVVWTSNPDENPNKDGLAISAKKKAAK